jgi:hypothetical protein
LSELPPQPASTPNPNTNADASNLRAFMGRPL